MDEQSPFNFNSFIREVEKDHSVVLSYLNTLTSIEKSIITILYTKECALNIKQIQNEFVLNIFLFLNRFVTSRRNKATEQLIPLLLPYFDFSIEELVQLAKNDKIGKREFIGTNQEAINQQKKILGEFKVNFPSFEKIEVDLHNLQTLGYLNKREAIDKKSKGLWSLNPTFDLALRKSKFTVLRTTDNV